MDATAKLAQFAVECTADQMTPKAREETRRALLDVLGTILAGSQDPSGQIITEYVRGQGGSGPSSIAATDETTSTMLAALANGTMAHALDFDDVGLSIGHPSVAVIPAALAAAEDTGASGVDFLDSIIVGFEIAGRVGGGATREPYRRGYHGTSIYGIFGATAAVGRLYGLSVDEMRMAFGIAGSLAAGVRANFGTMTKPLHAGETCRAAIEAVQLAKAGFTADPNIIETQVGYGDTLLGHDEYDPAKMVEGLGSAPFVVETGVAIKKYPCCYGNHTTLDGMFAILNDRKLDPEDVEKVVVDGPLGFREVLIYKQPTIGLNGKFSLAYNVALALVDGEVVRDSFTDEHIQDQRLRDMVDRTDVRAHEDRAQEDGVRIEIQLKDGESIVHEQDSIRGNFYDPLAWDEIVTKFKDNASLAVDSATADELVELVSSIEQASSVTAVTAAMSGKLAVAAG